MPEDPDSVILHASAVLAFGRGLLIRGASGRGKSQLALALMALGADLVADDRVVVRRDDADNLWMAAPAPLRNMIEARGIGLLHAQAAEAAPLAAVLDLDMPESDRLPPWRTTRLLGVERPLLHNSASAYFPAALLQYLTGGRKE